MGEPKRLATNGLVAEPWQRITAAVGELDPVDLVLGLTLITVAYPGGGNLQPVLSLVALAGLLSVRLRRASALWFTLVGIRAISHVASGGALVDNHQYLLTYWCLAIAICLLLASPKGLQVALAHNARWLLAFCFGLAAIWKLLAGEYLDGTFFQYNLLAVERFERVAILLGGSAEGIATNALRVSDLGAIPHGPHTALLDGHVPRLTALSLAMATWTIGIELVIAGTMIVPAGRALARVGDAALILFIATTYLFAPVFVFASLLAVLGLARLPQAYTGRWTAYLVVFVLIPPVLLPWAGLAGLGFALLGAFLLLGARMLDLSLLSWAGAITLGLGFGMGLLSGDTPQLPESILGASLGLAAAVMYQVLRHRRLEPGPIALTLGGLLAAAAIDVGSGPGEPTILALIGLGAMGLLIVVARR